MNNTSKKRFIDVSHTVEHGMVTYKGLPAPLICDYLSREASREHYAPGTAFHIGKIEMVANTGTYIDAPFHRFAAGKDLAELSLSSLADLEGVVIRVDPSQGRAIDASVFSEMPSRRCLPGCGVQAKDLAGKAVLVQTGWSTHWRTDQYFEGHPFLTAEAAQYLQAVGVALVGIDSLNIDDIADGRRPVHTILLGGEIPIG
jgi:arylformamidase